MTSDIPTLRWGIIATGLISSWFVADLVIDRKDPKAKHIIQAIGSSSLEKGNDFVAKHLPGKTPAVYGSYEQVYADPNVDIVYIGTPHSFHKKNALDAISHGKHVLCEKPFTLDAAEAREVFAAAKSKGVFVMEGMWTRFFPLVHKLQSLIHTEKAIGKINRVFCDFSLPIDLASLPADSRLKNPALGAGALLDVGIYAVTWCLLGMDPKIGDEAEKPKIVAAQSISEGIDLANSVTLVYPDCRQAIATSSTMIRTPSTFCRIEGSEGFIVIEGVAASVPASFTVHSPKITTNGGTEKYEFEKPGKGFYWEADAVAVDIANGKTQSDIMPWAETLRVLDMLDEVKRQGSSP